MADRTRTIVLDDVQRFERRRLDALLIVAADELTAATAGDLAAVYGAHRAINAAVELMLEHRWDAA